MASSKSTVGVVHFSLMFFVMVSIVLGVVTYLSYKDADALRTAAATATADADAKTKVNRDLGADVQALKEKAGHPFDQVGRDDRANPQTVLGAIQADLDKYGGPQVESTISATLAQLRTELDKTTADYNSAKATIADLQNKMQGLDGQYKSGKDVHDAAAKTAQDEVKQVAKLKEEEVASKNVEITRLAAENSQLKSEKDALITQYTAQLKLKDQTISNLKTQNELLVIKLDDLQKVSFELPDGLIRKVDHTTHLVWINLGSDDKLPVRTTFSVYSKAHHGVGRGQEDIKGAIEVTRIVGPSLAEARILKDSLGDPIAADDPIYTPLWSPGTSEKFALVGLMDIEPDGHSDRELIHDLIANSGARVHTEVDDQGNRTGGKIDVYVKFLVMGDVPDPAEVFDVDKKKAVEQIMKHRTEMMQEAREYGVRIVPLNDFLAVMGYKSQRRLWRPGDPARLLKSGAHSTAVDETITDRESSGQTSGVYGRGGQTKQPTSSGQTSKVFGGSKGY